MASDFSFLPKRSGVLTDSLVLTRTTTGSYYDSTGTLQNQLAGRQRFTYDSTGSENLGLLIERQKTNYFINSTAPVTQTITLSTGKYTASVTGTGSLQIAANTATISGAGTATAGSDVTFNVTSAGTIDATIAGSVSHAQVEDGTYSTSPIITAGTSYTRDADVYTFVDKDWFGGTGEGTLFLRFTCRNYGTIFKVNDFEVSVDPEGSLWIESYRTGVTASEFNIGISWSGDELRYSINGAPIVSTEITVPDSMTTGSIGAGFTGTLAALVYYNDQKTDNEVIEISRAVGGYSDVALNYNIVNIFGDDGVSVNEGATISRSSTATVTDFEGLVKDVNQNEARFTGARRVENLLTNTSTLATQNVTTIAGDYTLSFSGTGSITLSGTSTESLSGTGASIRMAKTFTATAGTLTLTVSGSVTDAQLELVEGQANQNPSEYVSNGVIRRNLLTYSEEFWKSQLLNNSTITNNVIENPINGLKTVDKWQRNNESNSYLIIKVVSKETIQKTYTFSIYVKKDSARYAAFRLQGQYPAFADFRFDFDTGEPSYSYAGDGFILINALTVPEKNGWYRVVITVTTDSFSSIGCFLSFNENNVNIDQTDSSPTSSGFIFGAQLEEGSTATDYQPIGARPVYHGAGVDGVKYFNTENGNYNEQNLLLYSEQFDNAVWAKSNATITSNSVIAPDGTITADTIVFTGASLDRLYKPGITTSTNPHVFSLYVKGSTNAIGKTITIECDAGVNQITIPSTWTKFSVVNTSGTTSTTVRFVLRTGDTLTTEDVYVWGAQLVENGVPQPYVKTEGTAIDSNVVTEATGAAISGIKGYLGEPQRTNYITYSKAVGDSALGWGLWGDGCTITTEAIEAPNGVIEGVLLESINDANRDGASKVCTLSANTTYTASVYIKKYNSTNPEISIFDGNTGTTLSDLVIDFSGDTPTTSSSSGSISNIKYEDKRDSWWRVSFTFTNPAVVTTTTFIVFPSNTVSSTDGAYYWGAQLEEGAFATSYIPTEASTVTRSPDTIAIDSPIQNEFTVFVEAAPLADGSDIADSDFRLFGTTDSGTDTIQNSGTTSTWAFTVSGGGGDFDNGRDDFTQDTFTKLSFSAEQDGSNANILTYQDGSVQINETDAVTLDHSDRQFVVNNYSTVYGSFHYKQVQVIDTPFNEQQHEWITKQ